MEELNERFIACTKCPIHGPCGGLRGTGPQPAQLMIISDFPHDNDINIGQYFTGSVGTEYANMMKLVDIDTNSVYITSVVKCRPVALDGSEGTIKQEHINNCSLYLEEEICLVEPKVVMLLGQHAFRRFFPKDNFTDCRGTFMWSDKYNCYFVPTYNFTAMLGSAKFDPIIKKDYTSVSNYLKTGKVPVVLPPDYRYILKPEQFPLLDAFVTRMAQVPSFSFDIETTSTNYMKAKMISIAFSWKKDTGWVIPIWVRDDEAINKKKEEIQQKIAKYEFYQYIEIGIINQNVKKFTSDVKKEMLKTIKDKYKKLISEAKQELRAYDVEIDHNPPLKKYWGDKHDYVFSKIKAILENNTPKGGHNAWFDIQMLRFMGIKVNNYAFDTIIEHHLTDEERQHSLDALSWLFTDRGGYKSKKDKYLNSQETCWANIPLDVLLPYNAMDADVTQQLHEVFTKKLEEENLTWLYQNVILPAQRALLDATYYGALVDVDFVKKQQVVYAEKIKECVVELQQELNVLRPGLMVVESKAEQDKLTKWYKDQGQPVPEFCNLASTAHMKALFKDLGFKFYKQTKTGDSLDEEVLKKFAKVRGKGKLADILLRYREYSKMKSTYLDATLENLDNYNRIHCTYKLAHAVTGRTSCLAGDTPIYVVDDRRQVAIKDIKEGDTVLCFDDNLQPVARKVLWSGKTKRSKVVKVTYQTTGRSIKKFITCTADHKFRLRDGSYVEAKDLQAGDRVLAIEQEKQLLGGDNSHIIISVEPLDSEIDVYDITVQDYHNFIANGVCVHNCENPNLQNIPRDGNIKGMFIPSPGKVMVNIDMSQHELRVLSGLSDDKVMQQIYNEGRDLHLETAASIFGIPPSQVSKEQRVQAKRVNFGIPYGVSGVGLVDLLAADGIKISKTQGNQYIESWKKKFPRAAFYLENCKKQFSQLGYLVTPWGRKRRKYKKYYANQGKENASDRQAMNFPIQSFASDIVLSLIGKLYPILKSMNIPLLLTVHDSIVIECDESQLPELAKLVKQYTWLCPKELNGAMVCTEMEIGYRWSEVVPMNFDEPEYARWIIQKEHKRFTIEVLRHQLRSMQMGNLLMDIP